MTEFDRLFAELEKDFLDYLRRAEVQGDSLADIAQAVRAGAELEVKLEGEWVRVCARFEEEG